MDMDEFIDLCILCGCDYTHNIGGIGPIKAFKFIKEEGTIERVLKIVDRHNSDSSKKKRYILPEPFLYEESRALFKEPDVNRDIEALREKIKWGKPEETQLRTFLLD